MNFLLMLLFAALPMQSGEQAAVEREIRDLEAKFNGTYAENDLETYFSFYAEDATLIFSQSRTTVPDYSKMWHKLIADGGGVVKNDISDVQVRVAPSGDVAIATYLIEVHTRGADGKVSKERAIETDVWFKRDGAWKIVSLHYNARDLE